MLEPAEAALVQQAHREGMPVVEAEARRRGQLLRPMELPAIPKPYRAQLEMYRLLTGFVETNPSAVAHHKIAQYGPPCPQCRKPLRTPQARFCAACGFGQEDVTADTRPLVQRRPDFFA